MGPMDPRRPIVLFKAKVRGLRTCRFRLGAGSYIDVSGRCVRPVVVGGDFFHGGQRAVLTGPQRELEQGQGPHPPGGGHRRLDRHGDKSPFKGSGAHRTVSDVAIRPKATSRRGALGVML